MTNNTKKNIILRVEPEFHQNLKVFVTQNNTTFQEYIMNLIIKDQEGIKRK